MCAILNGIAAHGDLPPERRDVPRLRRLLPRGHPPRGAQPPAGHLRLHARQRRRRRGRADPRAGRDHPRPARHPEPRRHPPRGPGGDGGRVRGRARAHRRARRCSRSRGRPSRCSSEIPVEDAARGGAQGRLRRQEGDRAARAHPPLGGQRAAARAGGRRDARARDARRQHARASRASIASPRRTARRCCRSACRKRVVDRGDGHRRRGPSTSGSTASRSASTASGCRRRAREVMKELGMTAEHVVRGREEARVGLGLAGRRRVVSFPG